jgi:hypothetical protein
LYFFSGARENRSFKCSIFYSIVMNCVYVDVQSANPTSVR